MWNYPYLIARFAWYRLLPCWVPQAIALHFLIGLASHPHHLLPEDGRTGGSRHPSNKPHREGAPHGCASQVLCLLGVWIARQSPFEFAANVLSHGHGHSHGNQVWFSGFPPGFPHCRLVWNCTYLDLRGSAVNLGRHRRGTSLDVVCHCLQSLLYSPLSRTFLFLSV